MTRPLKRPRKRAEGRQPKHGARALERRLREGKLDRRTKTSKLLDSIEHDLAEDRGGLAACSNAERLAIAAIAQSVLITQAQGSYLLRQLADGGSPVGQDGAALPLLKSYGSYVNGLVRNLAALGLKPPKDSEMPSLREYLAERQNGAHDAQNRPTNDHREAADVEVPA